MRAYQKISAFCKGGYCENFLVFPLRLYGDYLERSTLSGTVVPENIKMQRMIQSKDSLLKKWFNQRSQIARPVQKREEICLIKVDDIFWNFRSLFWLQCPIAIRKNVTIIISNDFPGIFGSFVV